MNQGYLCDQRFQAADILMFMDFIRDHYGNQLGNSGKKQIRVECFLILCFTPGNTKAVLKVLNGFFYIYPGFICGVPFRCAADSPRISTEVLFRTDVNHSSAGRCCTGVVTMAYAFGFLCNAVPFPFHFGTDKFHGWKPAA